MYFKLLPVFWKGQFPRPPIKSGFGYSLLKKNTKEINFEDETYVSSMHIEHICK